MAKFEPAVEYVLEREGGWANNPNDKGGPTNFGITLATAQRHADKFGKPNIRTAEQLKNMQKQDAVAIYRLNYWLHDDIKDQRLATKIFDIGVNMGISAATRLLQCVLFLRGAELSLDGKLGPKTIAAANSYRADDLLIEIGFALAGNYCRIVERDPSQIEFLKGWCNRAKKVPQ